jgi:hypothetical protein
MHDVSDRSQSPTVQLLVTSSYRTATCELVSECTSNRRPARKTVGNRAEYVFNQSAHSLRVSESHENWKLELRIPNIFGTILRTYLPKGKVTARSTRFAVAFVQPNTTFKNIRVRRIYVAQPPTFMVCFTQPVETGPGCPLALLALLGILFILQSEASEQ